MELQQLHSYIQEHQPNGLIDKIIDQKLKLPGQLF